MMDTKKKNKRWAEEEEQFLKDNYLDKTYKELRKLLGKGQSTIEKKLVQLNLKKQPNWTKEENIFLKNNYNKYGPEWCEKRLKRTRQAIWGHVQRLKLTYVKQWTNEEVQFLKINFKKKTYVELGKALNKTSDAIRNKIDRLGLQKQNQGKEFNFKKVKAIIKKKGGTCLSLIYVNAHTKIKVKCKFGHVFETKPNSISNGNWCPYCAHRIKHSLNDCKKFAEKKNWKCLSTVYKNGKTRMKWECQNGHVWETSFQNLKNKNTACPYCNKINSQGEEITRKIFEYLFEKSFLRKRPKWLLSPKNSPMELDGYNKELGIAFEYQGIHHFKNLYNNLEYQQQKDALKIEICKNKKVKLIIIKAFRIINIKLLNKKGTFNYILNIILNKKVKFNLEKIKKPPYKQLFNIIRTEHFYTYNNAKKVINKQKITTRTKYRKYRKKDNKLPSNPQIYYGDKWIDWSTFLGIHPLRNKS